MMIRLQQTIERPRLWGLDAAALHDAWWRGHGVQVVRRGAGMERERGADLFLLVEPEQLVLFDLESMADRIAWRNAAVTRLRVVRRSDEGYDERVETDDDGGVLRITRRYRARTVAAWRVLIVRRADYAATWARAESRRAAWTEIRGRAGLSHVDVLKRPGGCWTLGRPEEERDLVAALVARWRDPDRAIEGIVRVAEGVWAAKGDRIDPAAIAIGPAWIGRSGAASGEECLVGPTWRGDRDPAYPPARVRAIREIEPGESGAEGGAPNVPRRRRRRPVYGAAKRLTDIALSGCGLIALAPLFLLAALAVAIDDGRPIFFGHRRQSRTGRPFRCWKFRTMARDADAIRARLLEENRCDGPQFFIADDPRVTRVGRVLRRFQIDELPQLWNVLVGQMSLVGPRPSPDDENQICAPWREIRLSVRPGITGLWQIRRTRRPGVDFQEWIRYDVEYVENSGWLYDMKILFLTIGTLMPGRRHASDEAR